jgi:hypothetical protein
MKQNNIGSHNQINSNHHYLKEKNQQIIHNNYYTGSTKQAVLWNQL